MVAGKGRLPSAVTGPWLDPPAGSPFPLSPLGDKGFFRVKVEE